MRGKIESINILDKSTSVAGVGVVDSTLQKTLDKIRRFEKQPEYVDRRERDSGEKVSPYTETELKKPTALSRILREKYGIEKPRTLTGSQQAADRHGYSGSTGGSGLDSRPKGRNQMAIEGLENEIYEDRPAARKQVAKEGPYGFQARYERAETRTSPYKNTSYSQNTFGQGSQDIQASSPTFARGNEERPAGFVFDAKAGGRPVKVEEEHSRYDKSSGKGKLASENEQLVSKLIDQKVNGFLIFQNTVKDQTPSKGDEDFSKQTSEKWFHMSKAERDEYSVLALKVRGELKNEFKDHCERISDIDKLQDLLEERITQVKK